MQPQPPQPAQAQPPKPAELITPTPETLRALYKGCQHRTGSFLAMRCFLAVLLVRPQWAGPAADKVKPEMLYGGYRKVYELLLAIHGEAQQRGWQTDFSRLAIVRYTERHGIELDKHVLEVLAAVEDASERPDLHPEANAKQYAQQIQDAHQRARVIESLMNGIQCLTADGSKPDAAQVVGQLQNEAANLAAAFGGDAQEIQHIGQGVLQLREKSRTVAPTFMPYVNRLTGGYHCGSLNLLVSYTGNGKSTFLSALAVDVGLRQNLPTFMVDLENGDATAQDRILANHTGLDLRTVHQSLVKTDDGSDPTEHTERLRQVWRELGQSRLHYHYGPTDTLDQVIALIRRFHANIAKPSGKPSMVVLDHLKTTLLQPRPGQKDYQAMYEAAERLAGLAGELDIAIVMGAQASAAAVGMTQGEHATGQGGVAIANAKYIAQPCVTVMTLRNLLPDEADRVRDRFDAREGDDQGDTTNALAFNSAIHLPKARNGITYNAGVPFHHHKGLARYEEVAVVRDDQGQPVKDDNGRLVESDELRFLHSAEIRRKGRAKAKSTGTLQLAS